MPQIEQLVALQPDDIRMIAEMSAGLSAIKDPCAECSEPLRWELKYYTEVPFGFSVPRRILRISSSCKHYGAERESGEPEAHSKANNGAVPDNSPF